MRNIKEIKSEIELNPNLRVIQIPSRSEAIIPVRVINDNIDEGIISRKEIKDGLFLAESLVKVNSNNEVITSVLNTTDQEINIEIPEIELKIIDDNFSNINALSRKNINYNSDRLKLLKDTLRLKHLNKEESDSIIEICTEFNHIFHLEGDSLTCTDSIQHEIKTTSQIPITCKTYRYPEIHKEEVNKQITKMLKDEIIVPFISPWSSNI